MYDEVDVYDAELKVEEDDEGYENPPSQVGKKYSQWKKEIDLWQHLTELDKCKQGVALALSLEGEARKAAFALGNEKLMADNGIEVIIHELDKLFEGSTVNKLQSENEMKEEFVVEKYSKSECMSKVSSQKLCKTNGIHPGKVRNLKLNPSFKGKISRCVFCKSKCHWVKDCPHARNRELSNKNDIKIYAKSVEVGNKISVPSDNYLL